jgi:hypothetical protein
MQDMEGVSR